jgi:acylphosphatase
MAVERLHAIVEGDVQGVGYRDFVRRRGVELALRGWVRNLPGGGVECVAEGDRAALEELLGRLRRGPSLARVEKVAAEWRPAEGGLSSFGIRA